MRIRPPCLPMPWFSAAPEQPMTSKRWWNAPARNVSPEMARGAEASDGEVERIIDYLAPKARTAWSKKDRVDFSSPK